MEELILAAEKQLGYGLLVRRHHLEHWSVLHNITATSRDLLKATEADIVAKLKEWAKPPRPSTLLIEVPFEWVMDRAIHGNKMVNQDLTDEVTRTARGAVKPWM